MPSDSPKIDDIIKSTIKQVPVTCLKFIDKFVVTGIGGDLQVFESCNRIHKNFKRIYMLEVFPSDYIYGIIPNNVKIIVFGGKRVAFIETNQNFSCMSIKTSWLVEDWILDSVWTSDIEVAILTAHNVLLLYQYLPSAVVKSRISCTEQCILYSGKILNSKWEELIVLSGTVYQEVIIWSNGRSVSEEYPVIHRLKGHKDSQICLWNRSGKLLSRWEHNGEIWCLDYSNYQVAVGGNGIIIRTVHPLPDLSSTNLSQEFGLMRNVVMSKNGYRIIITEKGYLLLYQNDVIDHIEHKQFCNYCILSVSPCRNHVVLGGIHGDIKIFKVLDTKLTELCQISITCRVFSLTWSGNYTIVANGVDGSLSVWELIETADSINLQQKNFFTLPYSKERWITCAVSLDDYLICGDRMGSLHLFSSLASTKDPVDSLHKLHDAKGVSDVKHINGITYSTGRDGTLREISIIDSKLVLLSTLKLPMDWATSVVHSDIYGLIISGFHGSNFVLWNVEERITLLQLDCGGGHRSFDFIIDGKLGNLVISYLRMKEMKYLCCPLERISHQTVLAGYHKKAINCSYLLSSKKERSACILTASEDNAIKICSIDQSSWKCSSSYLTHISSVRAVTLIDDVLVTAGGRAQIILWQVQNNSGETRLREIASHMIREESVHRRSWRTAQPLVDPEMRYMDLKIVKRRDDIYSIFSSCSDGMLRVFSFDKEEKKLHLINSLESNQSCLLKISVFQWQDEPVVVTGGTNGSVCFWYTPHDKTPQRSHSLHSLGVNSMDLILDKKHLILCTGGDDTTLVLTAFSLEKKEKESIIFCLREHVHYCQITGLKITDRYILSIGLDQRLCVINWSFDGNFFKTSIVTIFKSTILDIHGLLAWPTENSDQMKIFVFGRGFEVLHFDRSKISLSK
ncbi:tRNA (34-2'-O)-methyltransferase regulator WDR6 isoform X2 [Halyomorpha halys]|uniref:tRNA (34-2'-O)-methyltransferase regulator WDR6 isoform X2 n=1 Tax=Halyomorpha halys TaxID=286706 RepID=UPI000D0C85B4|nr:WD repeat-containing protein 6 isoform X2 [Halyomorpha halys]